MDVVKAILSAKSVLQAYKAINLNFTKSRYPFESLIVGYLAAYALNLPKNKIKPRFETVELIDIILHLQEEFEELKFELRQESINFDRVLSECADVAALIAGLVAWLIENRNKET